MRNIVRRSITISSFAAGLAFLAMVSFSEPVLAQAQQGQTQQGQSMGEAMTNTLRFAAEQEQIRMQALIALAQQQARERAEALARERAAAQARARARQQQ